MCELTQPTSLPNSFSHFFFYTFSFPWFRFLCPFPSSLYRYSFNPVLPSLPLKFSCLGISTVNSSCRHWRRAGRQTRCDAFWDKMNGFSELSCRVVRKCSSTDKLPTNYWHLPTLRASYPPPCTSFADTPEPEAHSSYTLLLKGTPANKTNKQISILRKVICFYFVWFASQEN